MHTLCRYEKKARKKFPAHLFRFRPFEVHGHVGRCVKYTDGDLTLFYKLLKQLDEKLKHISFQYFARALIILFSLSGFSLLNLLSKHAAFIGILFKYNVK